MMMAFKITKMMKRSNSSFSRIVSQVQDN